MENNSEILKEISSPADLKSSITNRSKFFAKKFETELLMLLLKTEGMLVPTLAWSN